MLNNPTPATRDYFGSSVAVSGSTVVVGAYQDDTGATDAGSAYIFDAATGNLIRTLNNPSPGALDYFGYSVAVSGSTVVVGAPGGASGMGEVYVFDGVTGQLLQTLNNPRPQPEPSWFGSCVAVSGSTVVTGAYWQGNGVGAAYLFDAATGILLKTLNNPTPASSTWQNPDCFGDSVALSESVAIVGAYGDDGTAVDSGTVYVFDAARAMGIIAGSTWKDLDNDGVRDAGEPPQSGWTIYLDGNGNGQHDAGEPSQVTDASGRYFFADLQPGSYTLREVVQPGWIQTCPPGGAYAVDLTAGEVVTGKDFGNYIPPSRIEGDKWSDLDGDGARDAGEPALPGWTIFLDTDNDGTLDAGEPSRVTDASGHYAFINLNPGTYTVREVMQSGWVQAYPGGSGVHAVVLTAGQTALGKDFGNFQAARISGDKWDDVNSDGVRDAGEPTLPGWTIYLDSDNDGTLDAGEPSQVTSASGHYVFDSLAPGTYVVREVPQSGCTQTSPAGGAYTVNLAAGQAVTGRDFGDYVSPGQIEGDMWNDLGGDGVRDPGGAHLARLVGLLGHQRQRPPGRRRANPAHRRLRPLRLRQPAPRNVHRPRGDAVGLEAHLSQYGGLHGASRGRAGGVGQRLRQHEYRLPPRVRRSLADAQ